MNKKELRSIELKAIENGENKMVLEGYAVVFEEETQIGDEETGFREIIDRNALSETNMKDVPLKYNHSDAVPILARTRNNSLVLTVDEKGLKIHAELLDTQDARDMYKRIQAGLLNKMSFAFTVERASWTEEEGKAPLRRVEKIDRLFDVSIVDLPAYEGTDIGARRKDYGYREHAPKEIMDIIERYTL